MVDIAQESLQSLYVEVARRRADDGTWLTLGSGTAFVADRGGSLMLVTNIHVLTGRNPTDGEPAAAGTPLPSRLRVWHVINVTDAYEWRTVDYELYDEDGRARWIVHPEQPEWDIAALPVHTRPDLVLMPYSADPPAAQLRIGPASDLSIIGFPFGIAAGGKAAVWSRATVATDPSIDYTNRPIILVDSRSRPGQSGSPVIAKTTGMAHFADGSATFSSGSHVELIGVYSGRVNEQSDLGIVWKAAAIRAVLDGGRRAEQEYV